MVRKRCRGNHMRELGQSSINEFLTPIFEATEVSVRAGHTFDYRFVYKKAEIRFIFAPAETPDHYRFSLVPVGFPDDSFEAVAKIDGIKATPGGLLFGEFRLDIGEFVSPSSPVLAGWIAARKAPDKIKKGYKKSECYLDEVEMSLSEIRTRIQQENSQRQPQSPAPNSTSLSDELLKISELHKSGVLTDEEFQAAKQLLIG